MSAEDGAQVGAHGGGSTNEFVTAMQHITNAQHQSHQQLLNLQQQHLQELQQQQHQNLVAAIAAIQAAGGGQAQQAQQAQQVGPHVGVAVQGDGGEQAARRIPVKAPRYSGNQDSMSWLAFKAAFTSYKVLAGLDDNRSKLVMHASLTGRAMDLAMGMSPVNETMQALSLADYVKVLDNIFLPASEISLLRSRFRERTQQPDESVQSYASAKRSLFSIAYAGELTQEKLEILLESYCKGLKNEMVQRATMNHQPPFTSLDQAIEYSARCVATERDINLRKKSGSMEGLMTSMLNSDYVFGPITRNMQTGGEASNREVPMDMSALLAAIVEDPDIGEEIGIGENEEMLGAVFPAARGGFRGRAGVFRPNGPCFRCGAFGHGFRTCNQNPGFRRMQNQRGMRRGNVGGVRSRSGIRGRGWSLPSYNNIEEKEDEDEELEDDQVEDNHIEEAENNHGGN